MKRFVAVAIAFFSASEARADLTEACTKAYVEGQKAQKIEKDPLRARELYASCAKECTDDSLRVSCGKWVQEVQAELGSIVIKADAYGHVGADYAIAIDGKNVASAEGEPIDLNPGDHVVAVTPNGKTPIEQRVVVHAGEKLRALDFEPPKPPPTIVYTTVTRRPVTAATFVTAAITGVALVSWAVFGLWTVVEYSSTSSCTPSCQPSSRDPAFDGKAIAADVSLGVAVAALATTIVLFATRPRIINRIPRTLAIRF
jgi:hypothetical protein